MREFKFRAYDKLDGMKYFDFSDLAANRVTVDHGVYDVPVMQYTGLKDKNGTEIYEGDILRFPAETLLDEKSFIGYEVFYHDNDCADRHVGFQMNRMRFYGNLCGGECKGYMLPKYTSRMLIIGNIYEGVDTHE